MNLVRDLPEGAGGEGSLSDMYEADLPVVGTEREIAGCLLAYDARTDEFVACTPADEGRVIRLCIRPFHHEGPCRVGGPTYTWRQAPKDLREG